MTSTTGRRWAVAEYQPGNERETTDRPLNVSENELEGNRFMNETIFIPRLEELAILDPEFEASFMHLGGDKWEAFVMMRDCGAHLMFVDCELHLYRGPQILGTGSPPLFAYGFHPNAVSRKAMWRGTWTRMLQGIKRLFGRGTDYPTPWIDTHPIYQTRRPAADLLFQSTNGHPEWNRFKSFTPAGEAWLKERTQEDDLVRIGGDSIPAVVHPKDYGLLAADAEADGLLVWRP